MSLDFSPQTLYRLPWNLADNAISWLEPTSKCNIYCDGCYRENRNSSHKSLEEVQSELDVFESFRKTDGVSIAGGDPLTHPQIVDIVKMVKKKGWKAVINTNGSLLTKDLLHQLKLAGVDGFTFHVDSGQNRPNWKGKNELELNDLRLQLANMLAEEGGITCSFNATVYPENLKYVPELLKWSQQHIDKIHVMVFIIYRISEMGNGLDFWVGDQQVYFDDMVYTINNEERHANVTSPEVVDIIRKEYPDFMPAAFLNGTHKIDSYKWLLTGRMGNKHQIFGYIGPRFMELVQTFKHFFTGSYLAYSEPKWQGRGRLYFLMAPIDKGLRTIAKNYFKSFINNPKAFFKKVHYQSVMIIQPIDILERGETNMCDGCPDMRLWNGEVVWSCRMEEQMKWGQNVHVVPQKVTVENEAENRVESQILK